MSYESFPDSAFFLRSTGTGLIDSNLVISGPNFVNFIGLCAYLLVYIIPILCTGNAE
jgi:hypothetical protein